MPAPLRFRQVDPEIHDQYGGDASVEDPDVVGRVINAQSMSASAASSSEGDRVLVSSQSQAPQVAETPDVVGATVSHQHQTTLADDADNTGSTPVQVLIKEQGAAAEAVQATEALDVEVANPRNGFGDGEVSVSSQAQAVMVEAELQEQSQAQPVMVEAELQEQSAGVDMDVDPNADTQSWPACSQTKVRGSEDGRAILSGAQSKKLIRQAGSLLCL
jgi:hypothetical protein